jgi:hypothetical protein
MSSVLPAPRLSSVSYLYLYRCLVVVLWLCLGYGLGAIGSLGGHSAVTSQGLGGHFAPELQPESDSLYCLWNVVPISC